MHVYILFAMDLCVSLKIESKVNILSSMWGGAALSNVKVSVNKHTFIILYDSLYSRSDSIHFNEK